MAYLCTFCLVFGAKAQKTTTLILDFGLRSKTGPEFGQSALLGDHHMAHIDRVPYTEGCMGEQASLEFDLTFGDVLLHKRHLLMVPRDLGSKPSGG